MRFSSIVVDGTTIGVVSNAAGRLVPISSLGRWHTVRQVIEAGEAALRTIATTLTAAVHGYTPDQVTWAAPVPDPSKVLGMALNNAAIDQFLFYRPDFPVYFPKLPSTLAGSGVPLALEGHHGLVHPEPELGVVIGKRARNVALDDAMDHVFGYMVLNDVTSAGMRLEDKYFGRYPMTDADGNAGHVDEHLLYQGRYKNVDGFLPAGPYLVTADEIPDPLNLSVRGWVDDDLIADDNTRNLHYTVAEVIYWISAHCTLNPGDVIQMGTAVHPDGKSKPLSHGDINRFGNVMRVEIEGLGTVETPVRRNHGMDPRDYFIANKRFVRTLEA